jgi:hypothetical protein
VLKDAADFGFHGGGVAHGGRFEAGIAEEGEGGPGPALDEQCVQLGYSRFRRGAQALGVAEQDGGHLGNRTGEGFGEIGALSSQPLLAQPLQDGGEQLLNQTEGDREIATGVQEGQLLLNQLGHPLAIAQSRHGFDDPLPILGR